MLIKLLFQKFIVYIMNNLCAKFGCHISSNSKDKQGGGIRPPPGIECFKSPRSDRVKQKFTKRSQVSKYETRRANDLQVPRPRREITKKSFWYKGAKVWNDIPNNIRNVESAALFKKQVRNYFLGQ